MDIVVRMPCRKVIGEEPEELVDLLGELVVRVMVSAERCRGVEVGSWCPAQTQIDPSGREGVEHAELLRDDQRRMVRQHHPAGSEADAGSLRGQTRQHQLRRGRRSRWHRVMLGQPEPVEATRLCKSGNAADARKRGGCRLTDCGLRAVQHGQGKRCRS